MASAAATRAGSKPVQVQRALTPFQPAGDTGAPTSKRVLTLLSAFFYRGSSSLLVRTTKHAAGIQVITRSDAAGSAQPAFRKDLAGPQGQRGSFIGYACLTPRRRTHDGVSAGWRRQRGGIMPTATAFAANEARVDVATLESWRCPRQRAFSAFLLEQDRGSIRFGGCRVAAGRLRAACVSILL